MVLEGVLGIVVGVLILVGGVASVIFGVLVALWPREGLVALVWIFGIYALVYGVTQLVLAYRVRRMNIA
jgi:uncharacterized membrane protein HdeD (DUF308 family)